MEKELWAKKKGTLPDIPPFEQRLSGGKYAVIFLFEVSRGDAQAAIKGAYNIECRLPLMAA